MRKPLRLGKTISILPIASESFGVRSSSFYIMFHDMTILLDPSVSLAPRRYGKKPHPCELLTAALVRRVLLHLSSKANVIIVSHYHGDHYTIPWKRYYEYSDYAVFEKTYFNTRYSSTELDWKVRNPDNETEYFQNASRLIIAKSLADITWNQKKRALAFWKYPVSNGTILCDGDNKIFCLEDYGLRIEIIGNITHGCDSSRGNIIMTLIVDESSERSVLFSSDVEGPCSSIAVGEIKRRKPELVFLDGPSFYHPRFEHHLEEQIVQNVDAISDISKQVFMDHHFNRGLERDAYCREKWGKIFPDFSRSIGLTSANLESRRKDLWGNAPIEDFDPQEAWETVTSEDPRDSDFPFELDTNMLQHFKSFLKEC